MTVDIPDTLTYLSILGSVKETIIVLKLFQLSSNRIYIGGVCNSIIYVRPVI